MDLCFLLFNTEVICKCGLLQTFLRISKLYLAETVLHKNCYI